PVYDFRVYALAYYGDLLVNYGDNIQTAQLASSDFTLSPNFVAISVINNCNNLQGNLEATSKTKINPYKYIEATNHLTSLGITKVTNMTDLVKGKQVELSPNSTKVFPNPTVDFINVELAEYVGQQASISIVNTLGQTLEMFTLEEVTNNQISIDLASFDVGIYIVNINVNGLLMDSHKLVKK
ncbi:MAG: T9SS type A sorting domain-containing protein, partial [Saprospiraceae bacterium]